MSLGVEKTKYKINKYGRQEFLDWEGFLMLDVVLDMHCDEQAEALLASWEQERFVASGVFPNPEWRQQVHKLKAGQQTVRFLL